MSYSRVVWAWPSDFGHKTQAALAQFQLSRAIPAGGQLDEKTLSELGVARPEG